MFEAAKLRDSGLLGGNTSSLCERRRVKQEMQDTRYETQGTNTTSHHSPSYVSGVSADALPSRQAVDTGATAAINICIYLQGEIRPTNKLNFVLGCENKRVRSTLAEGLRGSGRREGQEDM